MKIESLDHLVLRVSDVESTCLFYKNILRDPDLNLIEVCNLIQ